MDSSTQMDMDWGKETILCLEIDEIEVHSLIFMTRSVDLITLTLLLTNGEK